MNREQFINKWGMSYTPFSKGERSLETDHRAELEQDLDELLIDLTPSPKSSEGEYIVELNDKWFTVINHT